MGTKRMRMSSRLTRRGYGNLVDLLIEPVKELADKVDRPEACA